MCHESNGFSGGCSETLQKGPPSLTPARVLFDPAPGGPCLRGTRSGVLDRATDGVPRIGLQGFAVAGRRLPWVFASGGDGFPGHCPQAASTHLHRSASVEISLSGAGSLREGEPVRMADATENGVRIRPASWGGTHPSRHVPLPLQCRGNERSCAGCRGSGTEGPRPNLGGGSRWV